jgi:hypothetical protein
MKTIAKKTAAVSHSLLAHVAAAGTASVTDPLPTEKAPSPPATYVPTKLGRGFRPQHTQVAIAPKMASELRASTSYAEQFGAGAPPAATVASALETASSWSGVLQNATAWYQYVKQQEALSWKQALGLTDALRVPFDFSLSRGAAIGEALPSSAKFFAATKETAKKSAATRKSAKKKEAKSASPAGGTAPAVNTVVTKSVN